MIAAILNIDSISVSNLRDRPHPCSHLGRLLSAGHLSQQDPRDAEVNPAVPWKVQGMSAQQTLEKEKGWEWGNFAFSFASAFFFLTMPMYHIYKKHECF